MIFKFLRRNPSADTIQALYGAIVAQARERTVSQTSAVIGAASEDVDPRHAQLHAEGSRNRMEVFSFDPDLTGAAFGAGAAEITKVSMADVSGQDAQLLIGGEVVTLSIDARVMKPIEGPIFGFYVKDRLGQRLFGDNTYLSSDDKVLKPGADSQLRASFCFRMPILPTGDYTIDVALASGTQDDHTQQHWIHDALTFRASESTMKHGLVGVPMLSIELKQLEG